MYIRIFSKTKVNKIMSRDRNPKLGVCMHLEMAEYHVRFFGHFDLDLWPG